MIMRQCIFACSHLETALQIAQEEPAFEPLLSPLRKALEEVRGVQEEVSHHRRRTSNVVALVAVTTGTAATPKPDKARL